MSAYRRYIAIILLLCFMSAGCTQNPGDTLPPDDAQPQLGSVDESAREAMIDAANERFATLVQEPDKEAAAQKMLEYLQGRPEFISSGINGTDTYGVFADGTVILFLDNRTTYPGDTDPEPKDIAPLKPLISAGIPYSPAAYSGNALGTRFRPAAPVISGMLTSGGYGVDSDAPTVEKLRSGMGNLGVLYLDSHAGWGKTLGGQYLFGVWTATPYDPAHTLQYLSDLVDHSLIFITASHDSTKTPAPGSRGAKVIVTPDYTIETHYGFTDAFVNKSTLSFSEDSMVFINACQSSSQEANALRDAFFAKGAASYLGWIQPADDILARAAAWNLFDRLLGLNQPGGWLFPESPPQRAFEYGAILSSMISAPAPFGPGLSVNLFDVRFGTGRRMTLSGARNPSMDQDFGLLAPSIRAVYVDAATDQLHVGGRFGYQKPDVHVDGQSLNVLSYGPSTASTFWPEEIVCDLPRDAFGDVTVFIDDRKSNTVQLTQWELKLIAKTTIKDPTATGQIDLAIHANIKLRACLNDFRQKPRTPPVPPLTVLAAVTREVTGKVEASGTIVAPPNPNTGKGGSTTTAKTPAGQNWVFVNQVGDAGEDDYQVESVNYVQVSPDRGLKLHVEVAGYWEYELKTDEGTFCCSKRPTGFASNSYFDTAQPIQLQMDDSFTITGGKVNDLVNGGSTLEWETATAQSPPDPNAAR